VDWLARELDPAAADGHTTTTAYGRLAVVEGELVWDRG